MPRLHRSLHAPQGDGRERDAPEAKRHEDDKVDESLTETFPASDPPSFVPPSRIGAPLRPRG